LSSLADRTAEIAPPGWHRLLPVLRTALVYTHGLVTEDDVLRMINEGGAQFWPTSNSVAVTELVVYPRGTMCRIWLGAGELSELRWIEGLIRAWARREGCMGIEIIGREGWARALPGYIPVATIAVHRFGAEEAGS